MDSKHSILLIRGIPVEVVRKDIKNLHLAVYPPDGRVRIAVPWHVSDDNIRLVVASRLAWVRRRRAAFEARSAPQPVAMISGESHYFMGQRYRLEVIEQYGRHHLELSHDRMQLKVSPDTSTTNREKVLNGWYREQLKQQVPALIEKWQPVIGVQVAAWHIRKMKTRWGSCNINARRIWLNLELIKKPSQCLEYVLVHEMVHLLERYHNSRFKGFMNRFYPQWPQVRDLLNRPLEAADNPDPMAQA